VRLETVMWEALQDIADRRGCSVDDLATEIDGQREGRGLSVALRHYIVEYYRESLRRKLENAGRRGRAGGRSMH
jgi:predicted DNA-binding ribbon-helix-helix protein